MNKGNKKNKFLKDKDKKTALELTFCRSFPAWLMQATILYFCLCLPVNLFLWVRSDNFLVTGHT